MKNARPFRLWGRGEVDDEGSELAAARGLVAFYSRLYIGALNHASVFVPSLRSEHSEFHTIGCFTLVEFQVCAYNWGCNLLDWES